MKLKFWELLIFFITNGSICSTQLHILHILLFTWIKRHIFSAKTAHFVDFIKVIPPSIVNMFLLIQAANCFFFNQLVSDWKRQKFVSNHKRCVSPEIVNWSFSVLLKKPLCMKQNLHRAINHNNRSYVSYEKYSWFLLPFIYCNRERRSYST